MSLLENVVEIRFETGNCAKDDIVRRICPSNLRRDRCIHTIVRACVYVNLAYAFEYETQIRQTVIC